MKRFLTNTKNYFTSFNFTIINIEIKKCVHYCGFKYGKVQYNPYESYLIDYHNNIPKEKKEKRFVEFLKHYRPKNFGEALGINLERNYPLWQFPWSTDFNQDYNATDMYLLEIPDIITHFSSKGILYSRIIEEFEWLNSAYDSISKLGYQPQIYGYIEAISLQNEDKLSYILIDGNHRVSALSALGEQKIMVKINKSNLVNRENYKQWPGVDDNKFSEKDALEIFDLYFKGNQHFITTNKQANIIF